MKGLSVQQLNTLRYIASSIEATTRAPTLRELCAHLGIKSTNGVQEKLVALERKGYLRRDEGVTRGLYLTEVGRAAASGLHIARPACPECGRTYRQ